MIARRGVNTLVLEHRTELLRQWQERLQIFLGGDNGTVGVIGGGKSRPSGRIDIAVMQLLHRQGETASIVENYGHVIVDEYHHLSVVSFEAILKHVRTRYVIGPPWCWRCRSRRKARCSSMLGACTASRQENSACASSTSSTQDILLCCACGSGGNGGIRPWGIEPLEQKLIYSRLHITSQYKT